MKDLPGSGTAPDAIVPLLARLFGDFAKLAKQELALAGVEIKKKLVSLVVGIVCLIVVALLGVAILATLTACLILAFALIVPPWLAALIVTGIFALVAIVLALVARSAIGKAIPPRPQANSGNHQGEPRMGETPNDIKRDMSDTRASIENTVDALKTSTASTASDVKDSLAKQIDALGTKAGDVTTALAQNAPTLANPTPLLIACAVVGFAAGFVAPVSAFERKRLEPVGADLFARVQNARQEILGQSKAVVDETLSAAKSSVDKHSKSVAENLGV